MPRVIEFDRFGGPEVLQVRDADLPDPATGEVRVRIEAFAINPLDVMARSGQAPAPVPLPRARLGVEATGVVDALGAGVSAMHVGDPVIIAAVPDAAAHGTYADYVTVPTDRLLPRPPQLDVPEAAAVWVAYSTAYGALVETAGMRAGDQVVITAASGAVGRAAVQLAAYSGAHPIAITRSTAKSEGLRRAGAAVVVATDAEDLVAAVARRTEGRGADIALDLVGGPGVDDIARATRPDGSLILAGFLDPRPAPLPYAPVTLRRYRSFDHTLDPIVVRRMASFLDAATRAGALRPSIERIFPIDRIADAHAHLASARHQGGKIVVTT